MELIPKGEDVTIIKLKNNIELNNTYGSIIKWLSDKQRYIVKCNIDGKKRLIKDDNLGWVKFRNNKPEIIENTTTFFISETSKNCLELQKLLEIFIFPPSTIFNKSLILEIQERNLINYISITIPNNFYDKVMNIINYLSFKITKGVPLIKVINGNLIKQLETRSNKTYTLKSEKINVSNYIMLSLNKKDIDHYLSLVGFITIKHWVKFYWSDRDISKNFLIKIVHYQTIFLNDIYMI